MFEQYLLAPTQSSATQCRFGNSARQMINSYSDMRPYPQPTPHGESNCTDSLICTPLSCTRVVEGDIINIEQTCHAATDSMLCPSRRFCMLAVVCAVRSG